jgi:isoleucyl-tRNA synthetase
MPTDALKLKTVTESGRYKTTVRLPQTKFDMRANAVKREPELQSFWAAEQVYDRLSQTNPGEVFILHDGPPYANGDLHMGHALNKILKDTINKFQLLQGRKVRYVPGWDCHGLPIELKVLQKLSTEQRAGLTPIKLRWKARDFALKTVDQQRESFKRFGVWGEWDNPYLTLQPEYEAAQIEVFGQMVLKGYIYRGLKPVHWSPSSQTALAEAELEYPEGHTSPSLYAAFEVTSLPTALQGPLDPFLGELGVAIWTTTPWTLPGNLAIAVNPDLTYAIVHAVDDGAPGRFKYWLVAQDLVETLQTKFETPLIVEATVMGKALEHMTYRHPLFDRQSEVVMGGDYITTESGTGLVHTAPGHGQEDYQVGLRYGLPIVSPVDDRGFFTEEAGPFAGLKVVDKAKNDNDRLKLEVSEGNQAIIDALNEAGSLLHQEAYSHKYPYDWRTKQPTIFRATEQWFASVEGFREEALKAIASVEWIPAQGQNRITSMVSERSDWCISRQRCWGVPIPVFYDEETNEPLLNAETIAYAKAIIAEKGSDAWWELSVAELLPETYRNNGRTYRKGTDTMDVWFDSGSSWAAVVEQRENLRYPADIYLEGSDQHRGWFQSSLLTSVAVQGIAPFKTVLTAGFVVDEQGRKMSKSIGNVMDPMVVIEGGKNQKEDPPYGADVVRLWVSSVDYSSDVPVGKNILKQMSDVYRKIRNTARFLLGSLSDFDPATHEVAYEALPELDRYMLHRIAEVFAEVTDAYQKYEFFRVFQTVQNFCVVDLSNFYLDIAKDRLYISASDAPRRRSCQTVLWIALENLVRAIAPILSHMAEDIWQFLPYPTAYKSVFEAGWIRLDPEWTQSDLGHKWSQVRQVRQDVNKVMEQARVEKLIGASLDSKALLYIPAASLRQQLTQMNPTQSDIQTGVDELRYLFLASQVELVDSATPIEALKFYLQGDVATVGVTSAEGHKCDRCWNYSTSVGLSQKHPLLCDRCETVIETGLKEGQIVIKHGIYGWLDPLIEE